MQAGGARDSGLDRRDYQSGALRRRVVYECNNKSCAPAQAALDMRRTVHDASLNNMIPPFL